MLENQLTSGPPRSVPEPSATGPDRRLSSDHERDHSAAAALSSLGRVNTPSFHSPSTYRSPVAPPSPLPPQPDTHENETYEWDEGGDEKELGIDAMGAASTRDYKPGFFGILLFYLITETNKRRLLHVVFHGGDQSSHIFFHNRFPNGHHNTIFQSTTSTKKISLSTIPSQ